jgi:dipeptidyl aminopeptidase/acylaminoacyl peptidase
MKSWRFALAALALGSSSLASGAPAERPEPSFTGSDLFNLSAASDPRISPDGQHIAYVRQTADIMTDRALSSIWLIDVATGSQRPLVAGPGMHSQPRWSPDGKRLAYISTAEGGAAQLYVRWMDSGESVRITGLPDGPQGIAWSPDGRRLAYVMTVPDEGLTLGKAPPKPEGAVWAKPLENVDKVTSRAD